MECSERRASTDNDEKAGREGGKEGGREGGRMARRHDEPKHSQNNITINLTCYGVGHARRRHKKKLGSRQMIPYPRVGSRRSQNIAGRVRSDQEVLKISRDGSGALQHSRVGSGQADPKPTRSARSDP